MIISGAKQKYYCTITIDKKISDRSLNFCSIIKNIFEKYLMKIKIKISSMTINS